MSTTRLSIDKYNPASESPSKVLYQKKEELSMSCGLHIHLYKTVQLLRKQPLNIPTTPQTTVLTCCPEWFSLVLQKEKDLILMGTNPEPNKPINRDDSTLSGAC